MAKHMCSTAQLFGILQQQGPRRCWATTGQAQGCRCGLPDPTPCHTGALQRWDGEGCLPGSCLRWVPSQRGMAFAFVLPLQ